MARAFAACVVSATLCAAQSLPDDAVIRPGQPWFDTDNNRIYAGGANILKVNDTFYLVGEGIKSSNGLSSAFNLYKSTDLASWTFVREALVNTSITAPLAGPYRMERPKIFQCQFPGPNNTILGNGNYMIWFHCDTADNKMQSVGVATSATGPKGPYSMVRDCFQPEGLPSSDMGMYYDGRGAFLIRTMVLDNTTRINNLTYPLCDDVNPKMSTAPAVGAGAIYHAGHSFYLFGSQAGAPAFQPTASQVFQSISQNTLRNATWKPQAAPTNDTTTLDSQGSFIYPFDHSPNTPGAGGVTYMYLGDRWNADGPGGLANATLVWLPVQKGESGWELKWLDSWRLADFCGDQPCNSMSSTANGRE